MQNFSRCKQQKGVVLFICLIALVVLLIAGISLIRSTDTALLISGNLAVKRDLTNQAENAIKLAVANFQSALANENARWNSNGAQNYSAVALASNAEGIPTILFNDAAFTAAYTAPEPPTVSGISYLYVIDRMCPKTGSPTTQHCISASAISQSWSNIPNPTLNGGTGTPKTDGQVVYRITVRVTDARQTQSFVQATLKSFGS